MDSCHLIINGTEQRIFKEAADFNKRTKGRTDLDLNLDTSGGPKADVQYGPGRRATDFLERFAGDQLYQNQLAGYNQTLYKSTGSCSS